MSTPGLSTFMVYKVISIAITSPLFISLFLISCSICYAFASTMGTAFIFLDDVLVYGFSQSEPASTCSSVTSVVIGHNDNCSEVHISGHHLLLFL